VDRDDADDYPLLRVVVDDEDIHRRARLGDTEFVLTNQRLVIATEDRVTLDIPISGLRRIQFDIERQRPATLVIVPEEATHEPQVIPVPPEDYPEVAEALVAVGRRLAESG
jgi:hypothetical protein